MAFSLMVLEPTIKFICSDVHPGLLPFRRISMKFSYCLDACLLCSRGSLVRYPRSS
jgi:hypothetical protein